MRYFRRAFLAALIAIPVAGQQITSVAKRESASVVEVTAKDQSGKALGIGSGFVVRADGILVTNNHVIEGAASASVELSNGDIYDDVVVLDSDNRRDLVILKIKALNLQVSKLGDSDTLEVDQHVIAIGNPEGLVRSVSDGIVSAIRRGGGLRVIQVTAPISHGSSGGPLLNDNGQVVGITFGLFEDGQNLNVAVPINYLKPLLMDLDRRSPQALIAYNAGHLKSAAPSVEAASKAGPGSPSGSAVKAESATAIPAEMKEGIAPYLDRQLTKWTAADASHDLGEAIQHRYAYDTNQTVDGDIYAYADPTQFFRRLELNFDIKTQKLRAVYIYPWKLTWDECKRIWGDNAQKVKGKDGSKFYFYRDRRISVYLDKNDNVINYALLPTIMGR